MFSRRITTQMLELKLYVTETLDRVYGNGKLTAYEKKKRELVRDDFNIHKIIVVVTSAGKVQRLISFISFNTLDTFCQTTTM